MKRKRATAIVEMPDGILLVSHSILGKPTFMLPGGGIKRKETPSAAVARELYEETGLCALEMIYLFEAITKFHKHKVFLIKKFTGKLKSRREIRHINFYSKKVNLKLAKHVLPIINKYKDYLSQKNISKFIDI